MCAHFRGQSLTLLKKQTLTKSKITILTAIFIGKYVGIGTDNEKK
jgi:hypothetical protein